jgi:hypothetical protein
MSAIIEAAKLLFCQTGQMLWVGVGESGLYVECPAVGKVCLKSESVALEHLNSLLPEDQRVADYNYELAADCLADMVKELTKELANERDELQRKLAAKDDLASALEEYNLAHECNDVVLSVNDGLKWFLYDSFRMDADALLDGHDLHTAAQAIRSAIPVRVTLEQAQAAVASGDWDVVERFRKQEEK